MESTIEKVNDVIVLTLQQEALDSKSAKSFREELDQFCQEDNKILLDLSKVEFVDSAGLGAIVAALKCLRGAGGDLKVCNVHKTVRALFELVRMHRLVDIFNTREEALA